MKKLIFLMIILSTFIVNIPNIIGDQGADDSRWSTTEIVSTESSKASYRAILDVDKDGTVHIAWLDNTNYNSIS